VTEWEIIGGLFALVLTLVGVIYGIQTARLKKVERGLEGLPAVREHYLKEISLTYARKEALEKLELEVATKAEKDSMTELRHDMREHRQETRDGFNQVVSRLNAIVDRMGKPS
jgi:hypothetical protein